MFLILQMDPGVKSYRYYSITDVTGASVGQVLVPKTTGTLNGVTYDAGTEYWFDVAVLSTLPSALTFSWEDYDWTDTGPSIGTQSFRMPEDATWARTDPPASSSSSFVDNTLDVVLAWLLTYSGGSWGGTLTWYNTSGQNTVFGGAAPGSATLTGSTSVRDGLEWYTAAVSPS